MEPIPKHYPDFNYLENEALYGTEVFFPTELLHGLYDGGLGAGLDDYWNTMMKMPLSAGGFLWVFADEGIVRRDQHDSIDTHGNNAPDGILGPHREKEGSFFAIKEIWSPVYISQKSIPQNFDGKLLVENRYLFTNLNQCTFKWKLVSFGNPDAKNVTTKTDQEANVPPVSIEPGEKKFITLNLPASWQSSDALYLTAIDNHGNEIFTWSWPIHTPAEVAKKWLKKTSPVSYVTTSGDEQTLIVENGNEKFYFSKANGYLEKVMKNDSLLSLSGGPALAGIDMKMDSFIYKKEEENIVVYAKYKEGRNWLNVEWTFSPGMPVKLSYTFSQRGNSDFMGITFNYPEKNIKSMQWLGRGPYHVWKNRLKGLQFGVWEKAYNNTTTGETWDYPEFKGNHEKVYWVNINTNEFPFKIFMKNVNVFLQMLKTNSPNGAGNTNTTVNYPDGNIGIMNAIQAIGTKFHKAEQMGPQSQKNVELNDPYHGTIWLDFE